MRVCLSCIEMFGSGIYGGFGRATRMIGSELVKRGASVTVVVPKRAGTRPTSGLVDGMKIVEFNPRNPWAAIDAYRSCDADVYHSQDTWLGTWFAMQAKPSRKHVITFRDPLDHKDWKVETEMSGKNRLGYLTYRWSIDNPLVTRSVRKADSLYTAAHFLIPKVTAKYDLKIPPGFLATPVKIPETVCKAERPTVAFVGRFDKRKRPELFFELARRFPDVDFIAVGDCSDPLRRTMLHDTAKPHQNLKLIGAVDQFESNELSEILSKSWILVNTSAREGLPTTFIEAAAHRCAILSCVNPDNFASRFGHHVDGDNIEIGLSYLLDGNRWRELGQKGYEFVAPVFGTRPSIDAHLEAYAR